MTTMASTAMILMVAMITTTLFSGSTRGMQVGYYDQQCPHVERTVKEIVEGLLLKDVTAGASLLRLVFHDCQVKACDASILLVDDPRNGVLSELHSPKNFGIRRLNFINIIKEQIERRCPGVVSCADIIVLAARDIVRSSGGPTIPVLTGRKDSKQAYKELADVIVPPADTTVDELLQIFTSKGMTIEETVALLGSHTLGVSHCKSFYNRLEPQLDKSMSPALAEDLKLLCHGQKVVTNATNLLAAFNDRTNLVFDNQYFSDLAAGRGLLAVDANLASDPRTSQIVLRFSASEREFFNAYVTAFLKLTQAAVLSDHDDAEVRTNCSAINQY
ncbi:hypothetical protein KP509_30G052200 [Ceratopteris richardii]|uniref:Peroxidase n=1 Tax=Ceratopteris richardii TaxID=49495 RepID=A0A8T2R4S6_CERRI|nr:hypothetical protein KP509_30G052200 [Ceratopteris richardii]